MSGASGYRAAYASRVIGRHQPAHVVEMQSRPPPGVHAASTRTLCSVVAAGYTEGEASLATCPACKRELSMRLVLKVITANGASLLSTVTDAGLNTVHHQTGEALMRRGPAEIFTEPDGGRRVRMTADACPGSGGRWGSGTGNPICPVCHLAPRSLEPTARRMLIVPGWSGSLAGQRARPPEEEVLIMTTGNLVSGPKSVRYWPYPGNAYHELAVVARSPGLEVIVSKGDDRQEGVGVQADDVAALCDKIRHLAGAPDPATEVRKLPSAIRDALEVPVPADHEKFERQRRILAARAAVIHGALGAVLSRDAAPAAAARTIRRLSVHPAVDYQPYVIPGEPAPHGTAQAS